MAVDEEEWTWRENEKLDGPYEGIIVTALSSYSLYLQ